MRVCDVLGHKIESFDCRQIELVFQDNTVKVHILFIFLILHISYILVMQLRESSLFYTDKV